ncbi:MAG: UxaA family hydrolase [Spirochaetales bacterium]|nr:UxaA family hydrolase [Spirochaetales bacterium]
MSFLGYARADGSVGVRNYIGVISTVACANDVAFWIAQQIKGTAPFLHQAGCCQLMPDIEMATRTLSALGRNPNLAGVLLVSLGCEGTDVDRLEKEIAASGKPVRRVLIQKAGATVALNEGLLFAQELVSKASEIRVQEFDDSHLVIGVKCGGSDTTSGLASNPAVGAACDLVVDNGGTCIFGETTEFLGAEHILVRRAVNKEVADKLLKIVADMEKRARASGGDMRGGNPTAGNIAGGLTSIEEKSLGAIVKSGTRPIQDVYDYGVPVKGKGLFVVDSPGREPEFLSGLAAAGAQICLFSTGLGVPQGFPFMPVIKVTGNPLTFQRLPDHIDVLVGMTGGKGTGLRETGERLYREVLAVGSGKQTKAEILGYGNFPGLYTLGPII